MRYRYIGRFLLIKMGRYRLEYDSESLFWEVIEIILRNSVLSHLRQLIYRHNIFFGYILQNWLFYEKIVNSKFEFGDHTSAKHDRSVSSLESSCCVIAYLICEKNVALPNFIYDLQGHFLVKRYLLGGQMVGSENWSNKIYIVRELALTTFS